MTLSVDPDPDARAATRDALVDAGFDLRENRSLADAVDELGDAVVEYVSENDPDARTRLVDIVHDSVAPGARRPTRSRRTRRPESKRSDSTRPIRRRSAIRSIT